MKPHIRISLDVEDHDRPQPGDVEIGQNIICPDGPRMVWYGHLEGGLAAARREAGTDRAAAQGQGQGMTRISMLTTAEAAARLDVSQRTLIRWRQSVPIIGPPPIRIGNGIRYAEAGREQLDTHPTRERQECMRRQTVDPRIRAKVIATWGNRCWLGMPGCSVTATEDDHIIPFSHGGQDTVANLRRACKHCNAMRQDRVLSGYGATLHVGHRTAARRLRHVHAVDAAP